MNQTGIVLYIKNFSKINGFVPKKKYFVGTKKAVLPPFPPFQC